MSDLTEIAAGLEGEAAVAPTPPPVKKGLSPRKAFGLLAVFLAITLAGLLLYILLLLSDTSLVDLFQGGDQPPGIEPILAIEGPGTGDEPRFDRPLGVAFGLDDRIYVADTGNNRVCVFALDGEFLFEFGGFGVLKPAPGVTEVYEDGQMNFPAGIDCDEDGNVYVADFKNDRVQVFGPDGEFLRAFPDAFEATGRGSSGSGGGIAVTDVFARDGKVYATDRYQVFIFDTEGRVLGQFGKPGVDDGDLDHPNGVAVDDDGIVYVSDSNHNRVSAFQDDGDVLWNLGRIPEGVSDTEAREFGLPRGLTVLEDGVVLVVDSFDFTLVRVSPQGELLSTHGERGVELGQFNFPNDVDAVDDLILVADKENDRVQLLRLTDQ